jgi:hypothetical protein
MLMDWMRDIGYWLRVAGCSIAEMPSIAGILDPGDRRDRLFDWNFTATCGEVLVNRAPVNHAIAVTP